MGEDRPGSLLEAILAADVDEDVLRALQVPQRRYVLYHLLDAGETPREELAEVVAGWMTAAHGEVSDRVEPDQLRTALYHTHLPVLADADLVEGDGAVAPTLTPDARDLVEAAYLTEHWTDDA